MVACVCIHVCTVTYLPLRDGYILTQSRDESPMRKAAEFPYYQNEGSVVFPKDMEAGGTWIGLRTNGATLCLLNGAFSPHVRKPPYRLSRGMVLLDALQKDTSTLFFDGYDTEGIEPFTLIAIECDSITVHRWNGSAIHSESVPGNKPMIWSSVPLYSEAARLEREKWFMEWHASYWQPRHAHKDAEPEENTLVQAARNFHYDGGQRDAYNGIMMDRAGMVRTVSVTTTCVLPNTVRMYYQARDQVGMTMASVPDPEILSEK
ncbi:MAG: NRDE family protein [Cyclobacteriaceae bacterium]